MAAFVIGVVFLLAIVAASSPTVAPRPVSTVEEQAPVQWQAFRATSRQSSTGSRASIGVVNQQEGPAAPIPGRTHGLGEELRWCRVASVRCWR